MKNEFKCALRCRAIIVNFHRYYAIARDSEAKEIERDEWWAVGSLIARCLHHSFFAFDKSGRPWLTGWPLRKHTFALLLQKNFKVNLPFY